MDTAGTKSIAQGLCVVFALALCPIAVGALYPLTQDQFLENGPFGAPAAPGK